MKTKLLVLLLATVALTPTLWAQCTLQLSEEGVVRLASGEERLLTWNAVPGASSYYLQETIEGLNEPAAPDFTFGGPYTESYNYEGRQMTEFHVRHGVTYKIRYRYTVTALNRENPAWQPCSDDVLFVIEPDQELATLAASRFIPIAGKTRGRNNSDYVTALILAGTGLGPSPNDPPPPPGAPTGEAMKLYQGRVYFRPLGTSASDLDPYIEYALGGDETLVYDDIMDALDASGIGTIEVRPKPGYPSPQADAIIDNRLPGNKRVGMRVPGALGRHHLRRNDTATVGIRNMHDARLSFGIRTLGAGGRVFFELFAPGGLRLETAERYAGDDMTMSWAIQDLFTTQLTTGHRVVAVYHGFPRVNHPEFIFPVSHGSVLFLTETGNDLDNPNVIYRESLADPHYSGGFDRFVIY